MKYRKAGLVHAPETSDPLTRAYAILPTPIEIGDRIRVYFASTDDNNVGRVFFVELDALDPTRVLYKHKTPVLDVGAAGRFDEHGVNPVCILDLKEVLRLYYVGYQRNSGVPYTLFMGAADSFDGGITFHRRSSEPILGPTKDERFFRTAAYVVPDQAGFRCLYIGGNNWTAGPDGKPLPIYGLRSAKSPDGLTWSNGEAVLEPDVASGQIGYGRPFEHEGGLFLSSRTMTGYSIWYSEDRKNWDTNIVPRSDAGWDSEMTCYAAPLGEYLFYNGNRFGRTGFGLAIREE